MLFLFSCQPDSFEFINCIGEIKDFTTVVRFGLCDQVGGAVLPILKSA